MCRILLVLIPEMTDCSSLKPISFPRDSTSLHVTGFFPPSAGCGSAEVPWTVAALPGQRIRVSLMDFGGGTVLDNSSQGMTAAVSTETAKNPASVDWTECRAPYAVVSDPAAGTTGENRTVCGGSSSPSPSQSSSRERLVYETRSNIIEIRIVRQRTVRQRRSGFLLKLQGAVFAFHEQVIYLF